MPIYALEGRRPQLPAPGRYWIAPDAHVIGDVSIGEGVSVWFGAVVRGDNEPIVIGPRSNVQEGALLHTDLGFPLTIGEEVTIGHHAILHGCSIGTRSLIGMGTTVLNGARVGGASLVGAHSLITERKVFADGSVILGTPARLVRAADAATRGFLADSAADYVVRWQRFAKGLVAIG
jgi:carbonic anhydrase/acetyltransferase-like protein (isoleucine patch superfamily)